MLITFFPIKMLVAEDGKIFFQNVENRKMGSMYWIDFKWLRATRKPRMVGGAAAWGASGKEITVKTKR
ncbi:MAG: hypothetical protein ACK4RM_11460 [Flavobacterium sp.]